MRLRDKVAIITGGGSGFGKGTAIEFVEQGARVVIADRDREAAERVAAGLGDKAIAAVADISLANGFAKPVKLAQSTFGGLHIVVNNAGLRAASQPLEEVPDDVFERLAAINMRSVYYCARKVVPYFKRLGEGVILNIASTGGVSPRPKLAWYNASKGWVIAATRAMAVELAPFGIRVNAINPVAGDTPMLRTFMGEDTAQSRSKFLSTIPLGRLSTPEDIGKAAAFLCSDEAGMVTGVAMNVDGGRCI